MGFASTTTAWACWVAYYTIETTRASQDSLPHGWPSAYLPDRSLVVLTSSNIYFAWTKASAHEFIADVMRLSAASLVEAEIQDRQELRNAAPYVNCALFV